MNFYLEKTKIPFCLSLPAALAYTAQHPAVSSYLGHLWTSGTPYAPFCALAVGLERLTCYLLEKGTLPKKISPFFAERPKLALACKGLYRTTCLAGAVAALYVAAPLVGAASLTPHGAIGAFALSLLAETITVTTFTMLNAYRKRSFSVLLTHTHTQLKSSQFFAAFKKSLKEKCEVEEKLEILKNPSSKEFKDCTMVDALFKAFSHVLDLDKVVDPKIKKKEIETAQAELEQKRSAFQNIRTALIQSLKQNTWEVTKIEWLAYQSMLDSPFVEKKLEDEFQITMMKPLFVEAGWLV